MRQLIVAIPLVLLLVGATSAPVAQYQLEWLTISGSAKSGTVNAHVTATIRNIRAGEGQFFHVWFIMDDGYTTVDSRQWEKWLPAGKFNLYLNPGESRVVGWAPQVRLSLPEDFCKVPFKVSLNVEAAGTAHGTGWMVPYCDRGGSFTGWKPFGAL